MNTIEELDTTLEALLTECERLTRCGQIDLARALAIVADDVETRLADLEAERIWVEDLTRRPM